MDLRSTANDRENWHSVRADENCHASRLLLALRSYDSARTALSAASAEQRAIPERGASRSLSFDLAGSIPLWAGGISGLNFVNSYVSQFNTGVAVVLYKTDTNLCFDAHVEATCLTSVFLLTGVVTPVLTGLFCKEHDLFGTVSMFALDQGVTAATLGNARLNIGSVHPASAVWFDNPAAYTVSGRVAGAKSTGWVTPGGGFSGTMCLQKTCTTQQPLGSWHSFHKG